MTTATHQSPPPSKPGFTLVEILVVITIIGILAGLLIPAITNSIRRANETALKLEVNSIAQAVEAYKEKYGDYPPDGSNEAVLKRHMRKLFPRMAEPDVTILDRLVDNEAATNTTGAFSPNAMDRAEALVFFLGGFSADIQHPITGPGGPLELLASGTAGSTDLADYQLQTTRDNTFFDFDQTRMTMVLNGARYVSNDETLFGFPVSGFSIGDYGGSQDLLPAYLAGGDETSPIVYFDSRTYGNISTSSTAVYNGYLSGTSEVGGIRPYKTEIGIKPPAGSEYADEAEAFAAVSFHRPNSFQLISPGLDGVFGSILSITSGSPGDTPVHFVTESGRTVYPANGTSATSISSLYFTDSSLGSRGYQDRDWNSNINVNGNLDNTTNFIEAATLEGELE
ncbi:prepilin-type N-terminal cleavage/methylation domain-containing protein [Rhodopirellula rubra]|uniref:Prepilin-type N-terminal cleavage/methylation domain-containing protein n=1 Tax=Aporhodopirellula rubra TaxID=980271 RepID=A0A7W5DUV3_9BACT|nr:prepilin-type N-terminal cleavage/methylation domain-containing protein [Aporhodopirellula rubra]MBB3204582.1 prepilin-type N-terminal cleavage/methylation domain-containing protein [Aporhodopirellula rubra]